MADPIIVAARVGLSGTRAGCTAPQLASLMEVLLELIVDGSWELHHGDEVGVCAEGHALWRACRQRVTIHPSTATQGRAHLDHDERHPRLPARERDILMMREIDLLVHAPGPEDEWDDGQVYRAARRRGLPIIIVLPSGDVRQWTTVLAPSELVPEDATSAPAPERVECTPHEETPT